MLPFHPVADRFPKMSQADFELLIKDMEVFGQRRIIALFQGMILDGRARAIACERLGIQPRYRILKATDDPAIYLIHRHGRYGEPSSPEREKAIKIFRDLNSEEAKKEFKRRKSEWLAVARAEFKLVEKKWRHCDVCKKHIDFVHAHHSLPLSIQFELGLLEAVHDHDWLCPVHHRIVHTYISIYIKETKDGSILDSIPDYLADEWLAAEVIFRRGYDLFKKFGGTSYVSDKDYNAYELYKPYPVELRTC